MLAETLNNIQNYLAQKKYVKFLFKTNEIVGIKSIMRTCNILDNTERMYLHTLFNHKTYVVYENKMNILHNQFYLKTVFKNNSYITIWSIYWYTQNSIINEIYT